MKPASGSPAAASGIGPTARLERWIAARATEPVPGGVDYPHILRTRSATTATSLLGVMLGLVSFMILTPLVMQGLAWTYWVAVGGPGEYSGTYRALVAYELPFGLAVGHLGLALLLPISWALVLVVHRVRPCYLSSVAGRLRMRWFWMSLPIGFVALWTVLLVQHLTGSGSTAWVWNPQDGAWIFLVVMLLTTPWQAAAEEYFFRGYLMQSLGSMVASPWFGIIASAVVFTVFHGTQNPALMADRFVFGVLAGWLVVRTGGLEAAIGAHVANNVSSFALAALTSSVAQVKAIQEVTWVAAAWDIARFGVFTAAIWLLARRWTPQTQTAAHSRRCGGDGDGVETGAAGLS